MEKRVWYAATDKRNGQRVAVAKLGDKVIVTTRDKFCTIINPATARSRFEYIKSESGKVARYDAIGTAAIERAVSRFYGG